jgi:hypothetical protein
VPSGWCLGTPPLWLPQFLHGAGEKKLDFLGVSPRKIFLSLWALLPGVSKPRHLPLNNCWTGTHVSLCTCISYHIITWNPTIHLKEWRHLGPYCVSDQVFIPIISFQSQNNPNEGIWSFFHSTESSERLNNLQCHTAKKCDTQIHLLWIPTPHSLSATCSHLVIMQVLFLLSPRISSLKKRPSSLDDQISH